MKSTIYTGLKFFGQKIFLEAIGVKELDEALKTTFKDSYMRTAPLEMRRSDVQLILNRTKVELESD